MKREYLYKKNKYPKLKNAEERLRSICYERAKEIFGEDLFEDIKRRIDWELKAIFITDTAFVLLLLMELMEKNSITPNEVSLYGVSGNSLVVYLCGITDFNPLDFDLPPCFVFGINHNKELDIALNIPSGKYNDLLNSCKFLEGIDNVICYMPESCLCDNEIKIEGIIYIPIGVDVYDAIIVNLCDRKTISPKNYYYFHDFFYMQNILANEELQLLCNLEKRTGVTLDKIKTDDMDILNFFKTVLQVPMNSLNDMIKIISFSKGGGVWTGNGEELIASGIASFDEVIVDREDMFNYLKSKGITEEETFCIVESVRKGKGLRKNDEMVMFEHNVPDWYIKSCNKIGYLPSKSSSISYVLKLCRLAYFRIHYPEVFYEEYSKINSDLLEDYIMLKYIFD